MPQKIAGSKKPVKGKNRFKKLTEKPGFWLFLAAGILLGGFLVYAVTYEVQVRAEKSDLLEKQRRLDEIGAKIAAIHPPDEQKSEQYCDRTSGFKYQEGDLYCVSSVMLIYENRTKDFANRVARDIENTYSLNFTSEYQQNKSDKPEIGIVRESVPHLITKNLVASLVGVGEKCSMGINYVSDFADADLEVSMSCSSKSKVNHFPLRK